MSPDRQQPTLRNPPADPSRLAGFPKRALGEGQRLYRAARQGNGPWYFHSSGECRFDLTAPEGTCYLAADQLGALLEVIGPHLERCAVSSRFLAERRVFELYLPEARTFSDLTSRQALRYGVTAEIGSIVPYALPQAWALRLRQAGSGGLVYHLRHDPAGSEGFALFGPEGEQKGWNRGVEQQVTPALIERLRNECGIEVLDVPRSNQLRILDRRILPS